MSFGAKRERSDYHAMSIKDMHAHHWRPSVTKESFIMHHRSIYLAFLLIAFFGFKACGDELEPRALRATELYSEYLNSLESFEGEYTHYTGLYPSFRRIAPPGRIGVFPLVKLDGVEHELHLKGRFWFSKGLSLERYETVSKNFDKNFKIIGEDRRLAAFNGQEVFAYHIIENSGSIYKQGQIRVNSLILASMVGTLLGKRINPNPPDDLIDYIRRATSLRVMAETDNEIRISGIANAIEEGYPCDQKFEFVLEKSRGYMPRYWHTGNAQFDAKKFSAEVVEVFEMDGIWLPKRGKCINYEYVMKGETENDGFESKVLTGGWVTIDPSTVKVNRPMSPELFTPTIPPGGRVANLITGEIINAEGEVLSVQDPVPMPALIQEDPLKPRSSIWIALISFLTLGGIAAITWRRMAAKS